VRATGGSPWSSRSTIRVWHIPFNRSTRCPSSSSGEDIYFGYEFAIQAGKKLPENVVDYYVGLVSNRESLRGSLAFYRAWDETVAQNAQRNNRPLTMPVLSVGGAASWSELAPYRDASAVAHASPPRAATASRWLG